MNKLKNNKAQANLGEYALIFLMAMTVLTVMSVYFKRIIQARLYDAKKTMVDMVAEETQGLHEGNVYGEYEPYYTQASAQITRSTDEESELRWQSESRKRFGEESGVNAVSYTLPPAAADFPGFQGDQEMPGDITQGGARLP